MLKSGLSALYKMLGAALTAQFTLRPQGMPFRVSAPPEDPRYWHQGAMDEKQYARMQTAERRRETRADKLKSDMNTGFGQNYAHWTERERLAGNLPKRKHPFYVAK